ncbi:hypothetical protein P4O66_001112 [Electrophorus voltai]|uniref:Protein FAM184A/B N-terminal domain-containing protein n=1 Tax=Electrophorus voltai TaxID=2609070 RepID=A0AAD9DVL8_9TELE|nr:hypothetical protein P4O66_001112 [Electrophorus voltai]
MHALSIAGDTRIGWLRLGFIPWLTDAKGLTSAVASNQGNSLLINGRVVLDKGLQCVETLRNLNGTCLSEANCEVIYALNTKNDEHEAAIQTLKEAHEEEVQQILSETREKIMQYKGRISEELDLRRRIQALEESMEAHERMKRQALAEFEAYRQRVEDVQLCAEAQHTQRVVSMSREVEDMRRSFEEKMRAFAQVQTQFEQEKRQALEELRTAHRQEVGTPAVGLPRPAPEDPPMARGLLRPRSQHNCAAAFLIVSFSCAGSEVLEGNGGLANVQELLRSHQSQNASFSKDQEKLGQLHKQEVEALTERVEELKQDKKRLVEEYEAKLSKAQAFYERELEAMKRTQQMTADNLLAWKKTEAELRNEFQAQESALQKTLGKLRSELQRVQDEARDSREKSHKLQASLAAAETNIKELHKQLDEVTQDAEIIAIRQKEAECELEATRDRVQQQATEILLKASQIGSLQATQMTHEAAIRDLESEKSRLKDKVLRLEEERGAIQTKSQTLEERQRQQILLLEKSLREEKQVYEKEVLSLRTQHEEDAAHFREAQGRTLEELSKKHRATLESTQSTAEKEKHRLLAELEQQFEKERRALEEQKCCLREELDSLREELTAKLNVANSEVSRLQEMLKQGEQGLGSAKGHISSLKEAQEKLLEELDATRARLRETTNLLTALQSCSCFPMNTGADGTRNEIIRERCTKGAALNYVSPPIVALQFISGEMEAQTQQHEAKLISTKEEEKHRMDKMALELELKWTETLRQECKKLREELREEHEENKTAALTQLAQSKEHELGSARESWHRKVEDLLEQISLLKQSLEMQLSQSQHSLQQLQAQFSQEREHLGQQLQELELEHQRREERLHEAHCCTIQDMQEARQHDLKVTPRTHTPPAPPEPSPCFLAIVPVSRSITLRLICACLRSCVSGGCAFRSMCWVTMC